MQTLCDLKLGDSAKIKQIDCNKNIKRRMMDLGIIDGTTITPILKSPAGNPRAYEVRGSIIAIRNEDAKNISITK